MDNRSEQQTILEKASLCVKCGLCLPHCPTYQLTQDENESPRGRITLMQGLASEKLGLNEKLEAHLNQCLSCRHCERVCPANVPYGSLIDQTRSFIQAKDPTSNPTTTLIQWIILSPRLRKTLGYLLWLYQQSGLRTALKKLGIPRFLKLSRLENLLPIIKKPLQFKTIYPAIGLKKGAVSFFTGCMSDWLDTMTLKNGIYALQMVGFDVHLPKDQACCGAIALHSGDLQVAGKRQQQNEKAFAEKSFDALIHMASGCGATLKEYDSNKISHKVTDISHFLAKHLPEKLKTFNATVLLHTPCTLRNVCKEENGAYQLLKAIPGLTVLPFSKISYCCGSAGTYMIEHPEWADELSKGILEELKSTGADYLATSNIGCAIHLQAAIKRERLHVKVVHPIYFLARALGQTG
ncbi:MAG: (Fe-S)-binding protein [Gammaproteobacteria bacterium]